MEKKELHIEYLAYANKMELSEDDQVLLSKAEEALTKAYSPYSHFNVGAAVLLENGEIFTGNNQENAAYPSGLCAERVAMFAASSQYPDIAIKAIAVTANSPSVKLDNPVTPCGACRQVMIEFENKAKNPIPVMMSYLGGNVIKTKTVSDLIPLSFDGNHLLK